MQEQTVKHITFHAFFVAYQQFDEFLWRWKPEYIPKVVQYITWSLLNKIHLTAANSNVFHVG